MIMDKLHKLEDELYFRSKGLSASSLKQFAKSPAHYKAYLEKDSEHKRFWDIGTYTHSQVLERKNIVNKLDNVIKVSSGADKEKALEFFAEKLTDEQFNEVFEDGTINAKKRDLAYSVGNFVTPDEYEDIQRMTESVTNHPLGKYLGKNPSRAELAGFAEDPQTGLLLKAKFDYAPDSGNILFDLKTTKDASPREFKWSIRKLGYDIQAVHYLNVANLCGMNYDDFYFIAVDSSSPYGTCAYALDDDHREEAENKYRLMLESFKECKQNNDFTRCYPDEVVYV